MKKLIAMLLALIMVCSLATVAFAADDETSTGAGGEGSVDNHDGIYVNGEEDQDKYLCTNATFVKKYIVNKGTAPFETFNFEKTQFVGFKDKYGASATMNETDAPVVTITDPEFKAEEGSDAKGLDVGEHTANATVEISNVTNNTALGIYTYKIEEKPGNTAGVDYTARPIYLNVTVLRDEESNNHYVAAVHYSDAMDSNDKQGTTDNSYDAGQLTVSKTITGNMAEMNKKFSFTVTFTPEVSAYLTQKDEQGNDKKDASGNLLYENTKFDEVQIDGGTAVTRTPNADGTVTVTFNLTNNESVVITNIPAGTTYEVYENKEEYTQDSVDGSDVTPENPVVDDDSKGKVVNGTINANEEDTASYNNDLTKGVDTGVALDSAPYILMLVVAMVGVVALVSKKRYEV